MKFILSQFFKEMSIVILKLHNAYRFTAETHIIFWSIRLLIFTSTFWAKLKNKEVTKHTASEFE